MELMALNASGEYSDIILRNYPSRYNKRMGTYDAVPCNATNKKNGWLVLDHQPLQLDPLSQQEVPDDINFISFLKSQPEYISQYYEDLEFCVNSFVFYENLGINLNFAIASDGGATRSCGSIGFVIASADLGNPIVTCWGQPAGIDPQSYWSEVCALLAVIYLICLLVEYYDKRIDPPNIIHNAFKIYTDSKSMLKKLERMDKYPSAPLKMVLAPNWDVLQAVFNELKWFSKKPSIKWLQSHQDDNPDTVQSIPVQLNVRADKLATKGLN